MFKIHEYVSNENSEVVSNLFKILELNSDFCLKDDEGNKKCTEIYFNNLLIGGYNKNVGEDGETVKVFKIFKGKNLIYDGPSSIFDFSTNINHSALFDPDNSVNQFENLHSLTIAINYFQILSNLSKQMESTSLYDDKSEFNQMVNSFITSKSLKNLKITSIIPIDIPIENEGCFNYDVGDHEMCANNINEIIEFYSNCFKPLFSELNTLIERIELDCCEPISIDQYLIDNIFTSPLTSIRHYKIRIKESNQLKLIFNLILNNIFKLQLYSLIFEFNEKELVGEFVKEFKNLINNISTQQQEQQESNFINLKEIKIKIKGDEYIQELNNPYFRTIMKIVD
ncbi:hypothetical protein ACTFIW_011023 [Dictyostelium discoideum]